MTTKRSIPWPGPRCCGASLKRRSFTSEAAALNDALSRYRHGKRRDELSPMEPEPEWALHKGKHKGGHNEERVSAGGEHSYPPAG